MYEELDVLDHLETPIFVLEPDEKGLPCYVYFNQYARKVSGLTLRDVIGKTALEVYPTRYGRAAFNFHQKAMFTNAELDYEVTLPIGRRNRTVRTHLRPIADDDENVIRIYGSSEDVSLKQEAVEMATLAQSLANEMEDFVALAVHDLKNPLRRVRSIAEALRTDSKSQAQLADDLEAAADGAMTLIGDVITHAQTTKAEERVEKLSLTEVCHEALRTQYPECEHIMRVCDLHLEGDLIATRLVIRNLIDNAVRHNPDRHLTLKVNARSLESGFYQVSVEDDGEGFSTEAINALFAPKIRAESGFGLAGARRLVTSRGGEMTAENRSDGQGAVVKFSLPGKVIEAHAHRIARAQEFAGSAA